MNDSATVKFGYAEIERVLPLSDRLKAKLQNLSEKHDGALNWSDPAGPSPWVKEDSDQFEEQALVALQMIRAELGDAFTVAYVPLGTS